MTRLIFVAGAVAGGLAVAMAAVAAHALPQRLDSHDLALVNSAIQMQVWHALALLATAGWCLRAPSSARPFGHLAGAAFMLGMLLFCGAVYCLAFTGIHLGPAAPIGGVCLMGGWALLAVSALRAGPLP